MTEKEWTPGPHKAVVGGYSTAKVYGSYRGKPGQILCEIVGDSAEAEANAYLFAAAEALYAATDWVDSVSASSQFEYVYVRLSVDELNALIDARRKARGE